MTGQRWVLLEPLTRAHIPEIARVAEDGELGRLWYTSAPKPQAAQQWVDWMLSLRAGARRWCDLRRARTRGALVGSSSFMHVDPANRRLEIGHTWYVASARRSGVNTETKL